MCSGFGEVDDEGGPDIEPLSSSGSGGCEELYPPTTSPALCIRFLTSVTAAAHQSYVEGGLSNMTGSPVHVSHTIGKRSRHSVLHVDRSGATSGLINKTMPRTRDGTSTSTSMRQCFIYFFISWTRFQSQGVKASSRPRSEGVSCQSDNVSTTPYRLRHLVFLPRHSLISLLQCSVSQKIRLALLPIEHVIHQPSHLY